MIRYVEDDAGIRNLLVYTLSMTGFQAKGYEDSAAFWQDMNAESAELVLLDVMLPPESGLDILRRLKSRPDTLSIPVILITARDREDDVVDGLELGADDYITKPFGMMELIARIKAVLRRSAAAEKSEMLCVGGIQMDTGRHTVLADGRELSLTLKEYELLRILMQNGDRLVERERLIIEVWSHECAGADHTLDAHMQTLRSKLGACAAQIRTVYGCGYRLCPKENEP